MRGSDPGLPGLPLYRIAFWGIKKTSIDNQAAVELYENNKRNLPIPDNDWFLNQKGPERKVQRVCTWLCMDLYQSASAVRSLYSGVLVHHASRNQGLLFVLVCNADSMAIFLHFAFCRSRLYPCAEGDGEEDLFST